MLHEHLTINVAWRQVALQWQALQVLRAPQMHRPLVLQVLAANRSDKWPHKDSIFVWHHRNTSFA
jgi:hypothetical protein